jgi:hypothetical protein
MDVTLSLNFVVSVLRWALTKGALKRPFASFVPWEATACRWHAVHENQNYFAHWPQLAGPIG